MDLAISVALGGDCLADVGLLRAEPAVYGRVASDPTVSRLIGALAQDAPRALRAIAAAAPTRGPKCGDWPAIAPAATACA